MFDDLLQSAGSIFNSVQENIGSIAGPFMPFGFGEEAGRVTNAGALTGADLTGGGGLAGEAMPNIATGEIEMPSSDAYFDAPASNIAEYRRL